MVYGHHGKNIHMKKVWRTSDLIDLEYFLNLSRHEPDSSARCDRDRYLKEFSAVLNDRGGLSRRSVFKWWLDMKRSGTEVKNLPGDVFKEGYKIFTWLFFISGALTGSGLGVSLLAYDGNTPVNVATWLGFTTMTQAVLLFILMAGGLLKLLNLVRGNFSILYTLAGTLFLKSVRNMKILSTQKTPAGLRDELGAALGMLGHGKKIYGSVFYWPVFIMMQLFGVGFNMGVLISTSLTVIGSDIAFGWQSTVQVSSQMLYAIVKTVSLPWTWFTGSYAYPSLAQIEGSRMVLKDGMSDLITFDLAAWWPFLCFTLLFYGLLPRLVLLGLGFIAQRRALDRLDFSHNDCDRLVQRLQIPAVNSVGEQSDRSDVTAAGLENDSSERLDVPFSGSKEIFALVPDDLFDAFSKKNLETIVQKKLGCKLSGLKRIGLDFESDLDSLEIFSTRQPESIRAVMVLQEAWQPPIREFLYFMKKIRECIGKKSPLIVGLIGKPRTETIFTPVGSTDWDIWNMKITALGDPWMRLERFGSDE